MRVVYEFRAHESRSTSPPPLPPLPPCPAAHRRRRGALCAHGRRARPDAAGRTAARHEPRLAPGSTSCAHAAAAAGRVRPDAAPAAGRHAHHGAPRSIPGALGRMLRHAAAMPAAAAARVDPRRARQDAQPPSRLRHLGAPAAWPRAHKARFAPCLRRLRQRRQDADGAERADLLVRADRTGHIASPFIWFNRRAAGCPRPSQS